jgi:protease-4
MIFRLNNWRRGRAKIDYITFIIPSQLPALPQPRDWLRKRLLGPAPLSLIELDRIFERIGADPRPHGVILHLRGFAMPLADLQTVRASIIRLRQKGKRVICFAQGYTVGTYYVACAADEIVMLPGGELDTIGLRAGAVFLKDALDTVGVKLDSVAISPFKGAFDSYTCSDMSPEGRAQLDWLLDSQFEMLLKGIAERRGFSPDAVRALIDRAPHLDSDALAAGYVDAVQTEEDLHRRLNSEHIMTWGEADKKLLKIWRRASEKMIALLTVNGLMVQGESGAPPVDLPIPFLGGERTGDLTFVQQVRAVMKNKAAAAVILYIDSGGGSALASEAMTSALLELAKDRPMVAYMNGVAASGGYYVATPAQWIVAQPGTITGSIGVIGAKVVTSGLFDRLRVKRVEITRGANANFQSDHAPYTDEQRARAFRSIEHIYQQFIQHVSRSRRLALEAVDAVGGGRVWTGEQALAHGLIDELGDWRAALKKARELANLPDHAPLVWMGGKVKPLPAQLAQSAQPAAAVAYLAENLDLLASGAPLLLMPYIWTNE